jgi:DNA-binding GntR family transcriptional regulator
MALDESLTGRAYRSIRDEILEGRLTAGTPLSRRRLADELGMSSVPVAEALNRLESEGVVESRPSAGTRVKIPTEPEVRGHYVLREALETHSARLFAERATARDRVHVRVLARALDRARGHDSVQGARAHFHFHMFIAQATGCAELVAAIERSRVLLSNWLLSVSLATRDLPPRWHGNLALVLAKGTPEAAAEAMRVHVRHRLDQVVEAMAALNERGAGERLTRGPQRRTVEKQRRIEKHQRPARGGRRAAG